MKAFNDLKMVTKLMAAFICVVIMTIVLGIFSATRVSAVNQISTDIDLNYLPSVRTTLDMNTNTTDFRVAELQHILSTADQDMDRYERVMANVLIAFEKNRSEYVKLINDPAELALYEKFKQQWDSYLVEHNKLIQLSRANRNDEAKALSHNLEGVFDNLSDNLLKLSNLNIAQAKEASRQGDVTYEHALRWIVGMLVGVAALGLGLAVFISRNLRNQLGGEPAYAVEVVGKIAAGDLSVEVEVAAGGRGSLLYAMRGMRENLAVIVGDIRGSTDTIASASHQIASGNADLSSRTEQQAGSLEETASSMEELTSTVRQNADNARQANQLAVNASEVAVRGGAVVSEVVGTMGSINESARKIVDIIGVIDGIAFQTNILALNAAVEAARAGEQGRGFAVVATEVRNLAQRSAAAAKDIKVLINDSVEKVDAGSRLVDQAGSTMQEVVVSIRQVTDIMGEITAASQEQSAGIDQVNQAISQMDQVTQQNAALVEEAAAAAEAMRVETDRLTQAIGVFQLGGDQAKALTRPAAQAAPRPRIAAPAAARQSERRTARAVSAGGVTDDQWDEF